MKLKLNRKIRICIHRLRQHTCFFVKPEIRELTVNENINKDAQKKVLDVIEEAESEDCVSVAEEEDEEDLEGETVGLQKSPSLGNNPGEEYIKVESMLGDRKWNLLVYPSMTVRDVIERLTKRVDTKYKFFELHQVYEDKQVMLLNPDIKVSWVIAAQSSNPSKYKLVFNFQETKYVQIESMVDGHKWNLKLGPLATVEEVCSKLALRMDSKFNVFQLFELRDKTTKLQLDPREKVFDIITKWGPHHGRHKLLFYCYTKEGSTPAEKQTKSADPPRRTTKEKLPSFVPPPLIKPESFIRKRSKFSSTSTLYANTTISKPDVEELLMCMAKALLFHVEKGCRTSDKKYYDIFNEKIRPLTRDPIDFNRLPSAAHAYDFVKQIYDVGRLDPECVIMALAYIEKLIEKTQITIDTTNWRRITFIALSVALKTWEDLAVYNLEFVGIFHGKLTLKDLNNLEMHFLTLLDYAVFLSGSLYAKYYFELRKYSKLDEAHFPLKPLDKEKAKLLELRTQSSAKLSKDLHHSFSVDSIKATELKAQAIIG